MKFSERYGYKTPRNELQINAIDADLRHSIWNATYELLLTNTELIYNCLVVDFFKLPLEKSNNFLFDQSQENNIRRERIHELFNNLDWFEVYDFIEFIINLDELNKKSQYRDYRAELKGYINQINKYLERECSAYRIVGKNILKLTNDAEISSIEKAMNLSGNRFHSIEKHLSDSLGMLSDRKNPNYRNSIKESISAVEACLRILTGKNTFGKALDSLEKSGIQIDNQLKSGFEKIYAFTNSKSTGIRHALIEDGVQSDFEDAMFMLVSCSAFINYLISKTNK